MCPRQVAFCIASYLTISFAVASEHSFIPVSRNLHPRISVFGGLANVNANHSQTFMGTDNEKITYKASGDTRTTGLVGVFIGTEHQLPHQGLFMQAGAEYTYLGNGNTNGFNTVGIEPETSTSYNYQYHIQTQQLLAVAKLFTTTEFLMFNHQLFYPFVFVGLGAAFNDASQFNASTQEFGSINLTPTFNDNTTTDFSYSLGLGVETNIKQHVRIGLGYRFSSFGAASLGSGQVVFNQYTFPTSFSLSLSNVYANQFIAQISYVLP